jgi:hypothetical protein
VIQVGHDKLFPGGGHFRIGLRRPVCLKSLGNAPGQEKWVGIPYSPCLALTEPNESWESGSQKQPVSLKKDHEGKRSGESAQIGWKIKCLFCHRCNLRCMAPLRRSLIRNHLSAVVLFGVMSYSAFAAQVQTSPSLGDLARKSREEKEKRAAPKTTFNDESLLPPPPTTPAPLNSGVETLPYQVKPIPKSWPSCAAAVAEFNSNVDAAHTDQHIDAGLKGSVSPSGDAWSFAGTVTATNTLTLSLPEWSNMPNDPRLQNAWNSMLDALRKHEEGHVKIAIDGLRQLDGAIITGTGASASAAQKDAQRKFGQLMQTFNSATQDEQNRYDALTNHGRKQSAVGGTDISLLCP